MGKTLFEKIWEKHLVKNIEGGPSCIIYRQAFYS